LHLKPWLAAAGKPAAAGTFADRRGGRPSGTSVRDL